MMQKNTLTLTLCLLFSMLSLAFPVGAVQLVDSTTATPGSHPTIGAAVTAASSGEEIRLVDGGPYVEEVMVAAKDNLTFTNPGGCVWNPPAAGAFGSGEGLILASGVTSVTLRDIILTPGSTGAQDGIFLAAPVTLTLDGVQVDGHARGGVYAAGGFGAMGGDNLGGAAVTVNMVNGASLDGNYHGIYFDDQNTLLGDTGYLVVNMDNSTIDGSTGPIDSDPNVLGCSIYVRSSAGPNALSLANGSSISNGTSLVYYVLANTGVSNTININDSTLTGNGYGMNLKGGAAQNVTISNSDCTNNDLTFLNLNSGSATVNLDTVAASSSAAKGDIFNVNTVTGPVSFTVNNCQIDNGQRAIYAHPPTAVGVEMTLTNCSFSTHTANALKVDATHSTLTLTNCTLTGNVAAAVDTSGAAAYEHFITVSGGSVSGGSGQGLLLQGAYMDIDMDSVTISGNGHAGMQLGGSGLCVVELNNMTVTHNSLVGLYLPHPDQTLTITNSTLDYNGGQAMRFSDIAAGMKLNLTMTDTTMDYNNQGGPWATRGGIEMLQIGEGRINMTRCSISHTQQSPGMWLAPNNGGDFVFDLTDCDFNHNAVDGFDAEPAAGGNKVTLYATGCNFDNNTREGLRLHDGPNTVVLNDCSIDDNGSRGFFSADTNSADLTSVTASRNGHDGVAVATVTTATATFSQVTANGNTQSNAFNGAFTADLTDCTFADNGAIQLWFPNAGVGEYTADNLTIEPGTGTYGMLMDQPSSYTFKNSSFGAAVAQAMRVWNPDPEVRFENCTFHNLGGGDTGQSYTMGTFVYDGCTFDSCANAFINRGADITLNNCSNIPISGAYSTLATLLGTAPSTVTIQNCENLSVSRLAWIGDSAVNVLNLMDSQFVYYEDGATTALAAIATDGLQLSTITLNVSGCDVLCPDQNLAFFHGGSTSNTVTATVDTSTFQGTGNTFHFIGATNATFDQCDFVSTGTAIWASTAPTSDSLGTAGTIDVTDCIFAWGGNIYNHNPDYCTFTEDYNLFLTPTTGTPGAIDSGENSVMNSDPDYVTTAWGADLYLFLSRGSGAAHLNSGNGPEKYAGAKGIDPTASVQEWWNLY